MLMQVFNDSPFLAINNAYPNKYKPWELSKCPSIWDKNLAREATTWMVKEKLGGSLEKITNAVFKKHGLYGMLSTIYGHSSYLALKDAFPSEDFSRKKSKYKNAP